MDTVNIIDLTRLCIQINNTVVISNHTHIKLIKKSKKHVNGKQNVLSNTMFRHSYGFVLRTFIVYIDQSDSVNNYASKLFFLINFQCLLV